MLYGDEVYTTKYMTLNIFASSSNQNFVSGIMWPFHMYVFSRDTDHEALELSDVIQIKLKSPKGFVEHNVYWAF